MAGGREDRGLYDGRSVSEVRMLLEVGATEESMVDAMYNEQGTQCIRSKGVAGSRKDRGLYDGRNV